MAEKPENLKGSPGRIFARNIRSIARSAKHPTGKQALFVNNQRRCDTPGIWLAVADPSASDFGVIANPLI